MTTGAYYWTETGVSGTGIGSYFWGSSYCFVYVACSAGWSAVVSAGFSVSTSVTSGLTSEGSLMVVAVY